MNWKMAVLAVVAVIMAFAAIGVVFRSPPAIFGQEVHFPPRHDH